MFELYSKSDARPAPSTSLEQALRIPVGVASPLWLFIGGAASAGMAYWWATQWLRPVNLEAFTPDEAGALLSAPVGGEAAPLAGAALVAAAEDIPHAVADTLIETVEPVIEATAQIAPEPVSFVSEPEPVSEIAAEVALAPPANDGPEPAPEPIIGGKRKTPPATPQA